MKTNYSTGSLNQVRQTVGNIQTAVDNCRDAYAALASWKTAEDKYNAAVAQAKKLKKPTASIPKPGQQPGPAPGDVPAARGVRHPGQCPAVGRPGVSLTGAADPRDAVRSR